MLLINKAIITENNTLISVGSFSRKESTELKGIIIFHKDNALHELLIEDTKIVYDVIEYKPNVILILANDGNGNCRIEIFYITAIFCRLDNILPIFKAEYQFAKTADGTVILYYNLKSPDCKTKAIIISLKDDLIYHSVVVVDQIIHSDNAINEYRPNQIWDFNLTEITPLNNRIGLATKAMPTNETVLILKFKPQYAELSSHDIITVDENDVLIDYQVCYNKLIIICRNEFEGDLISNVYIQEYQLKVEDRSITKASPLQKVTFNIGSIN